MPENCRFVRRLNLVRVTGGHETFLKKNYTLGPRAHKFLPASLSLSLPPPSPSLLLSRIFQTRVLKKAIGEDVFQPRRVFGVRFLAATVVFVDEKTSSTLV